VAAIYNEGIEERIATFETRLRSAADVEPWLHAGERLPLIVAERDGAVIGWARLLGYGEREVYAGIGEVSFYVTGRARGQGLGRRLLQELEQRARALGYWKLIALLFTENTASAALLRRCGWREVGVHERHARLDGEWRNVLLAEREL
jgi:L-amino acid N-acyltransferase YncA